MTAKQSSFRLPVHVAAKLTALCELYPGKTRTQIVGDLLASAIDSSVLGLGSIKGPHVQSVTDNDGERLELYEDVGPLAKFKQSANRHFADLEKELGNESPALLYELNYVSGDPDGVTEAFVTGERSMR